MKSIFQDVFGSARIKDVFSFSEKIFKNLHYRTLIIWRYLIINCKYRLLAYTFLRSTLLSHSVAGTMLKRSAEIGIDRFHSLLIKGMFRIR